jgi:UbiD family decarboxylase
MKDVEDELWRILGVTAPLRKILQQKYGRLACHLGLPPTADMKEILDKIVSAAHKEPTPPNIFQDGPVEENKLFGGDFDLDSLSSPWLWGEG